MPQFDKITSFFKKTVVPNKNNIQEKSLFSYFCAITVFCLYYTNLKATILALGFFLGVFFIARIIPSLFQSLVKNDSGVYFLINTFILWFVFLIVSERYFLLFFYFILVLSLVVQKSSFYQTLSEKNIKFINSFWKDTNTIENHFKYDFPVFYQVKTATFLMYIIFLNSFNFITLSLLSNETLEIVTPAVFNGIFLFLMNNLLIIFISQIIILFCNPVVDQLLLETCKNCFKVGAVGMGAYAGFHLNVTSNPNPIPFPGLMSYQNKVQGEIHVEILKII